MATHHGGLQLTPLTVRIYSFLLNSGRGDYSGDRLDNGNLIGMSINGIDCGGYWTDLVH